MQLKERAHRDNNTSVMPPERRYPTRYKCGKLKSFRYRVPHYLEYKKALTAQNRPRQELVTRIVEVLPPELQSRILKLLAEALFPTATTFHDFEKVSDFRMPEHIREGSTMSRMAQVLLETLGQVRLDSSRSCGDAFLHRRQNIFGTYERVEGASSPYRIEGIEGLKAHLGSHVHEAILSHVALISSTPWVSRQTSSIPPYPSHLGSYAKYIRRMHWDLVIPCNSQATYPSAFYTTLSNVERLGEWLPGLRQFRLAIIERNSSSRSSPLYFARGWSQELITIYDLLEIAVLEMRKSSIKFRSLCYCKQDKTDSAWWRALTEQALDRTQEAVNMKGESEDTIAARLISEPEQHVEL